MRRHNGCAIHGAREGGAPRESRESETYPYPQSRGYGGPLVSCLHVFHVRLACDLGVCRRRRIFQGESCPRNYKTAFK